MKEACDYKLYNIAIRKITDWIKTKELKFDGIFAPPRGGLIMGVHLSHLLNLPLLLYPTKNSLVVDDIADTGKTLQNIKNKKIITLYYHKESIIRPDFWVYEKKNKWITYWWEE